MYSLLLFWGGERSQVRLTIRPLVSCLGPNAPQKSNARSSLPHSQVNALLVTLDTLETHHHVGHESLFYVLNP